MFLKLYLDMALICIKTRRDLLILTRVSALKDAMSLV